MARGEAMKYLSWILNVVLIIALIAMAKNCHCPDCPEVEDKPETKAIKEKIAAKEREVIQIEKEVIKKEGKVKDLKGKKDSIHYTTDFDSSATIDSVKKELYACDSTNTISNDIIKEQDSIVSLKKKEIILKDTIIAKKDSLIAVSEKDNTKLKSDLENGKRDLKKQKRKNAITKIVAVVVVVASIILVR